jgi:hypothetical protein
MGKTKVSFVVRRLIALNRCDLNGCQLPRQLVYFCCFLKIGIFLSFKFDNGVVFPNNNIKDYFNSALESQY